MKNYRTMTKEEIKIVSSIIDFINENKIYHYTEVRDYALKSKPEWTDVLRRRNIIVLLIAYTDSKRRVDNSEKKRKQRRAMAEQKYSMNLKLEIVGKYERGKNGYKKLSHEYNIPRDTVRDWCRNPHLKDLSKKAAENKDADKTPPANTEKVNNEIT